MFREKIYRNFMGRCDKCELEMDFFIFCIKILFCISV